MTYVLATPARGLAAFCCKAPKLLEVVFVPEHSIESEIYISEPNTIRERMVHPGSEFFAPLYIVNQTLNFRGSDILFNN